MCVWCFPPPELQHKAQAVQTDGATEELGVNTDPDWEKQVAAMLEHGSSLTRQYHSLTRQQDEEELGHEEHVQQLQKKEEEAVRQHQVGAAHTPASEDEQRW